MATGGPLRVLSDVPKELLENYFKAGMIAIDTELHGLRLMRDQVCLVQISDRHGNVCLVRPKPPRAPVNLKKLLEHRDTLKVFHYALTDVSFLRASLGVNVTPFACTKVMSKLVRTYTSSHGLKDLVSELVGVEMDKYPQQTDWSKVELSQQQLQYAANDVLHLLPVYDTLNKMLKERGKLPSGITATELNEACQAFLPTLVDLLLSGYGDRDEGWDTSLFTH
ncbi:MAG: ribonuclease D [SAR324 cluster bacterium]|nr:ribonuclease D [SAR324 cluster bacterium]